MIKSDYMLNLTLYIYVHHRILHFGTVLIFSWTMMVLCSTHRMNSSSHTNSLNIKFIQQILYKRKKLIFH